MEDAIKQIIKAIPQNYIFDSHFVISQLIANHSNVYLNFAKRYKSEETITMPMHGHLGQLIAGFEKEELIEKMGDAYSLNIHGNSSKCTAWKKK